SLCGRLARVSPLPPGPAPVPPALFRAGRAHPGGPLRRGARTPRRNDPHPPTGDHGTAYPSPVATKNGKVLFTAGQGEGRAVCALLDPAWLEETQQRDDLSAGLDEWSIFGTKGVERVPHPDKPGTRVLRIHKSDADWPAAAVRNFPLGSEGRLRLPLLLQPRCQGLVVALTDHFSVPFDAEDNLYNLFNLQIASNGEIAPRTRLTANHWHTLELNWSCQKHECIVSLDGKRAVVLPQLRA